MKNSHAHCFLKTTLVSINWNDLVLFYITVRFVFSLQPMSSLKNYLLNFNLFESPAENGERDDEHRRKSNIIATRYYLALITFEMIIWTFVFALNFQAITVTIQHPTKEEFESLPPDAQCSCSYISIPYVEYTSFLANFHQVCSSNFVSDRWIRAIFSGFNTTYFHFRDFRTSGSAQFQALASFCRLSQASVQQSIASFRMSTLLSPQVLSEIVLRSKTQAVIDEFKLTAPNVFGAQLELVREMITGNQLMSGLETNGIPIYRVYNEYGVSAAPYVVSLVREDGSFCSCITDLDC